MNEQPVMVITGARKGIGRFLAEHYLERGFDVVGCSRGDSDLDHPHYHHHCVDIGDETAVKKMFAATRRQFRRLDGLLNNAGIASMNHSLLTPGRSVEKILRTNVLGSFLCCREGAKIMQKARHGRIVNFSTVAVPLKLEGEAAYAASKAAVVTLTHVLAGELGPLGITVNAVGPTPIETDLIRSVPETKIDALIQRQAIQRLGTFEDVANVVDFFLKKESDFITGQVLYLGGV